MDYSKKSKEELIKEIELLKKKEENISNVLYSINEMFYKISFDEKGKKIIDYISPQVENVLGLTTEEYINNKDILFEHFHPEELEKLIEGTKKMSKDQKQWSFTYRFYNKKKKKYVWLEETIVPIYNNKGKKTGLLGTARDVSKNRIREKQLSFILENIDECIYNVRFEKEGKELNFISKQIKDITGLTIDEYEKEGKSGKLIKRIHPDDVSIINKNIHQDMYKKNKKQIHSVFRFKPKGSKKYLWLEETLHVAYDVNRKPLETTTVIRDITKNKTIELHLKENEEKYRNLFTKNLAGVFITDKGIIIECNNSFAKIFGYKSRVELIGKKATDLYYTSKERTDYINELKRKGSLSNYKIRHRKKDGSEMWILTNVSIKEERVEGTLVDITEQIKTEQRLKESEKNYKELIESSPYGIFVHMNNDIVYANKKAYEIWGMNYRTDKNKSLKLDDFVLAENQKIAEKRSREALKGKEVPFMEFKVKKPFTNEFIYVEVKPILFNYQGNKALQVVFKDITAEKELAKEKLRSKVAEESNKMLQKEIVEREKIEKKLIENQKYTRSIINSSLDIICAADINGKIIEINKAGLKTFGYSEKELLHKKVNALYLNNKESLKIIGELKKNGIYVGEVMNKRKNGEIFTSFLSASLLYDKDGKVIGSMGVSRDITELKQAELQLIESEERYRDLFENATDLIQSVDKGGRIVYANEAWKKAVGYSGKEIKDMNVFEIIHPESKKHCQDLFTRIMKEKNNKSMNVTYSLKTKSGRKIVVEGSVSIKHKNGKPDSTRAILRDVTEQKKNEKILKESLKEKEVLLKEVHHRVKNNLQVISSILNLQSSYVKEQSTLNILKESQNRIKSMAFIHESLYQNNDFSRINFSEYVVSLSKNLVHSYGVYDNFVDLKLEVGEIFLNIDLSIPCGLIINELVSNSLKYAFLDKEVGEIGVELFVKSENIHLIVYDNGCGLPKKIDYKNTESLGLQLVMTLVEQLNGTIKLDNKKGAKYTIIFKKEQ